MQVKYNYVQWELFQFQIYKIDCSVQLIQILSIMIIY
ncbi:unnamed protein product [Paramecium primaurelia]|uniref:Uncharacterized protein n=1 Tax=Paramecium primaurelia TaxID=5886 RepID=A0A8S1MAH7_PARPR|nr:unnamed protein product [Paramecium primaurelia]